MDKVTQYAKMVVAGKIIACKLVKKACQRHLKDLQKSKNKNYPYYFDAEQAEFVFQFSELFCRHSKGEWAGQPVILESWQKFVVGSIFAWKEKTTNLRRFTHVYIQVARKNGKSTIMAVIGNYVLVCDGEPGAEIYSAATKKDQARIIFDEAKRMVEKSPELRKILKTFSNNINFPDMQSKFEPLSQDSDTMDGLNLHLGLIDELHAHKNRDVYDVLDSSTGSRRQPLIISITTAGKNPNSFCHEQYEMGQNILNEVIENDRIFVFIAELDAEDDWRDENVWMKANPNLGVSIKIDILRAHAKVAKEQLSAQNEFICKRMNRWVSSTESFVDPEKWKACNIIIPKNELEKLDCFVGLDLASRNDLCSNVYEFPMPNNKYAVLANSYLAEDRLFEKCKKDNVPYDLWAKEGYLTLSSGSMVDYELIFNDIMEKSKIYNILEICYDPWNATQLAIMLENEGFKCVEVRQGYKTLSEPTKDLECCISEQRIIHFNNPILTWNMNNLVVTRDANDNIRPDKSKTSYKIDCAMALIIAHTRAYVNDFSGGQAYKDRGVIVLDW